MEMHTVPEARRRVPDYQFEGIYVFKGKENPFEGSFYFEHSFHIKGEMGEDKNGIFQRYEIEGKITRLEDKIVLEFIKKPIGELYPPAEYRLVKEKTDGSFPGEYEGVWKFTEEGFDMGRENRARLILSVAI